MANYHPNPYRVYSVCLLVGLVGSAARLAPAQEADPRSDPTGDVIREALQRVMIPTAYLTDGPQVRRAFREVVEEATKATVRVKSAGKNAALGGIVGPDGWIVTKASRLKAPITVRLKDGREFDARLVGIDSKYDLAMLKVAAKGLPTLAMKRDEDSEVGEWVATVSTRRDPVAVGVVSVDTREIPHQPGTLGIRFALENNDPRVVQVYPGTGAEAAGVLVNDLIVAVNDVPTLTREKLIGTIRTYSPGDVIELTVKRGDNELALKATLSGPVQAMYGSNRREYQNNLGSKLSVRRFDFPNAFQHDTVLQPEDCGGPLVDIEGRVVGFNIARSGRTESYAIPCNVVVTRLFDLMSGSLTPKEDEAELVEDPAEEQEPATMETNSGQ